MSDNNWQRYNEFLVREDKLGFSLDLSRMNFNNAFVKSLESSINESFSLMEELESGAISNKDENRMVGHYWLRNPELSPNNSISKLINKDLINIKSFSKKISSGEISAANGEKFDKLLIIGIGGSALGPQLVADCLLRDFSKNSFEIFFLDNSDPDGFNKIINCIKSKDGGLSSTLCCIVSKSGGTKETRNAMKVTQEAYKRSGLNFSKHSIAITDVSSGKSDLFKLAKKENWIDIFPMYDWVGGRTSVMSSVGLVPMSILGLDIDAFLLGAAEMDKLTRKRDVFSNPSMMLALMWLWGKRSGKDMVVIPYKDSLSLLGKYLQQLIMESIGKEFDLDGKKVEEGFSVYGNKGSTDQHAYVQQLRDGVNNFFVLFIEILESKKCDFSRIKVEGDFDSSDFLQGFLRGTREALSEKKRENITLSFNKIDEFTLGMIIALFERSVGFYANLVNINAYHQPGVEAGKKAAGDFLSDLNNVYCELEKNGNREYSASNLAKSLDKNIENTYHCLNHLSLNNENIHKKIGKSPKGDIFFFKKI